MTNKNDLKEMLKKVALCATCSMMLGAGMIAVASHHDAQVMAEKVPVIQHAPDMYAEERQETIQLQMQASEKRHADEAEIKAQAEAEAAAKARRLAEYDAKVRAEEAAKKAEQEKSQAAAEQATAEAYEKAQAESRKDTAPAKTASTARYTWTSHGSTQADCDAGYMVSPTANYFAADIVTRYGRQIKSLTRGNVVSINGRLAVIDGEVFANYNDDDAYENIMSSIDAKGYDSNSAVCFQTCIPPYHGPIVVKFGHYVS